MSHAQKLNRVLRDLVALLEEEAGRNPAFAERLEKITAELPAKAVRKATPKPKPTASVPDVLAELQARGLEEFRFWLRGLDLATLKAVVKANGFDPGKRSARWRDADKFIDLIAEQAEARLKRGTAFLPPPKGSAAG